MSDPTQQSSNTTPTDEELLDNEWDGPSKSQVKREMHDIQDLGIKLTELTAEQLSKIPLSDELLAAIVLANKITHNSGKKRQLKFVGKLMRKSNSEEIEEAYSKLMLSQHQLTRQHHLIEEWRDQLLSGDNQHLQTFIDEYPLTDIQLLRQLIRSAQKESSNNKPPASTRKLFRLIRDVISESNENI